MKEAGFYERLDKQRVKCHLCAHGCTISDGRTGKCGVRRNDGGTLMSLVHGLLVSANPDPVEKKPLFHFMPGTRTFSIATAGCNFSCRHCQNSDISQWPHDRKGEALPGRMFTPEQVVRAAVDTGCKSLAYTYTEPTIALEFYLEVINLARERGLRNLFVSNGFMSEESARAAAAVLDANNIDLKGDDRFYREVCGARLEPVQRTISIMKEAGVWVEVTTLVIPGHNDSDEVLRGIARFIAGVDRAMPWHVTRFHPTYKMMDEPPTPVGTLDRAREIGLSEGLKYVYQGNIIGEGEDTHCPSCGSLLIKRVGFEAQNKCLKKGRCTECGTAVEGVW